jgi:DNA-binding response OmpR family regulator
MATVLVVDDDPAIGRLVRLTLASEDIEVERADSGESALAFLRDGHAEPDVILLDLAMPGMDGRKLFGEVRRAGITCPIVFCSAYGAEDANRQLGGQGAIDKPFDPAKLVLSIRALMNGAAA